MFCHGWLSNRRERASSGALSKAEFQKLQQVPLGLMEMESGGDEGQDKSWEVKSFS